ncbi:hypothetical protein M9H77_26785 [Catharanthus roseus]|uniref:Uncharacterized protein n=1 Tax=Catharanthus roseus TaxID=4058 RepID=A0ACC0ADD5_CATRO|nr:hypothetical protein M9H77_26785 [Catharanthus roseus]
MCYLVIFYDFFGNKMWVVLSVPRNYIMSLRTLRRTGCRGETRYSMPLLEVVGMTPTSKNFTVASVFMRNEQATTYRWVLQEIKHLYFSNTMSTENQEDGIWFNARDRRSVQYSVPRDRTRTI